MLMQSVDDVLTAGVVIVTQYHVQPHVPESRAAETRVWTRSDDQPRERRMVRVHFHVDCEGPGLLMPLRKLEACYAPEGDYPLGAPHLLSRDQPFPLAVLSHWRRLETSSCLFVPHLFIRSDEQAGLKASEWRVHFTAACTDEPVVVFAATVAARYERVYVTPWTSRTPPVPPATPIRVPSNPESGSQGADAPQALLDRPEYWLVAWGHGKDCVVGACTSKVARAAVAKCFCFGLADQRMTALPIGTSVQELRVQRRYRVHLAELEAAHIKHLRELGASAAELAVKLV